MRPISPIATASTVTIAIVVAPLFKTVSDYSEIFDGVPSQHDGKDAAMIAELVAIELDGASQLLESRSLELRFVHVFRLNRPHGRSHGVANLIKWPFRDPIRNEPHRVRHQKLEKLEQKLIFL